MGTTKNTKSSRDTVEGLAVRLREARESQGMTVRVAASRCGLTHDKISSVENETIRAGVTGNTLIKLSRGLGVSVDWLLGLSPYERPWAEMKTPRGPRAKRAAAKSD